MIPLEQILYILPVLALTVSVLYYSMNLRNANITQKQQLETRQAQLFLNIFNVYASKQFQKDREALMVMWKWTDYDDFFRQYGPDVNPDDHAIWDSTITWLEGLGVLVKRGLIDHELVHDIMYGFIINFWEKHLPIFMIFREQWGPKMFEDLEGLYDTMKELSMKYNKDTTAKFPELNP